MKKYILEKKNACYNATHQLKKLAISVSSEAIGSS